MDDRARKIREWLEAKQGEWVRYSRIMAAIQFAGGALVFLGFTNVLAVFLAFFPGMILGMPLGVCYVVAAVLVVALCWLHSRLHSEDEEFISQAAASRFGIIEIILTVVLFSVPILFRSALRNLRRAAMLTTTDLETCTRVLEVLLAEERRVELAQVQEALPDVDLDLALPDLEAIDGVLHLVREPPALALTDALREDLERAVAGD